MPSFLRRLLSRSRKNVANGKLFIFSISCHSKTRNLNPNDVINNVITGSLVLVKFGKCPEFMPVGRAASWFGQKLLLIITFNVDPLHAEAVGQAFQQILEGFGIEVSGMQVESDEDAKLRQRG